MQLLLNICSHSLIYSHQHQAQYLLLGLDQAGPYNLVYDRKPNKRHFKTRVILNSLTLDRVLRHTYCRQHKWCGAAIFANCISLKKTQTATIAVIVPSAFFPSEVLALCRVTVHTVQHIRPDYRDYFSLGIFYFLVSFLPLSLSRHSNTVFVASSGVTVSHKPSQATMMKSRPSPSSSFSSSSSLASSASIAQLIVVTSGMLLTKGL